MLLFLWLASRGYRFRPWNSPYLRWRVETYSGLAAESLDRVTFTRFVWSERRSLCAYLKWVSRHDRLLKSGN